MFMCPEGADVQIHRQQIGNPNGTYSQRQNELKQMPEWHSQQQTYDHQDSSNAQGMETWQIKMKKRNKTWSNLHIHTRFQTCEVMVLFLGFNISFKTIYTRKKLAVLKILGNVSWAPKWQNFWWIKWHWKLK